MKKEKLLVIACVLFGAFALLAACSKSGAAPAVAGGKSDSRTASAESTPAPAAAAPAAGYKEIKAHGFDVQWKVDGAELKVIESYPTTGWVGWGIGATGRMRGSTIIIGYVADGKLTIADTFGNGPNRHTSVEKLGGTNDLTDTSGSIENGVTTIRFTIPLAAVDKYHVTLVPGQSYKMLLAYASNGTDNLTAYHGPGNRFVVDVTL